MNDIDNVTGEQGFKVPIDGKKERQQKPDTEAAILRAAEEEFLDKGFDGARTTVIAEKAGVTHAMLHYYYRTKEKLFERMLHEKMTDLTELILGVSVDNTQPLLEKVRCWTEKHFDFVMKNPKLPFFILTEIRRNPERLRKLFASQGRRAMLMVRNMQREIDECAARGECRQVNAQMLLFDILSLNLFTFVGLPVAEVMFDNISEKPETMLRVRRQEIVDTIMLRLKL